MGFFKNLRETFDVATGKKEPDRSKLSPEQRAKVDKVEADRERRLDEAEAEWRTLDELEAARRAGLVIEDDRPLPPTAAERRAMEPDLGDARRMATEQLRQAGRALSPRALLGTVYGDLLGREPGSGSPEERQRVAVAEWEARAAARWPYRSPAPPNVTLSRVATRGGSQIDDVRSWLQATGLASRPDLVWSVHRVPDRISPNLTPSSEKGRVVEWEVVHQPAALPPSESPVELTSFDRRSRWIARRLGDPVPLDEEVGAWFLEWAQLEPASCFGIARLLAMRSWGGGSGENGGTSELAAVVSGVAVLHAPSARATDVRRRMEAERPVGRPPGPGPLRVDRLDWNAVAEHVHPLVNGAPSVPSPVPHLPSSPQEMLLAYLEVVGVTSADCAGAAVVTGDRFIPNAFALGPAFPVADGKARRRTHGAEEVVLVYRDRPEYAAGRDRWRAYQSEVLRARLDHATGERDLLTVPTRADNLLGAASSIVEAAVSPLDFLERLEADEPPFVAFPYCWPPVA